MFSFCPHNSSEIRTVAVILFMSVSRFFFFFWQYFWNMLDNEKSFLNENGKSQRLEIAL